MLRCNELFPACVLGHGYIVDLYDMMIFRLLTCAADVSLYSVL